jgi:hypothetical protein
MVYGLGFWILGLEFRVRVQVSWFRVHSLGLMVHGSWYWVKGSG